MTTTAPRDVVAPGRARRSEIEGLRTVAALLVAVYHVWLARVSGGVDVFFVVTGFFITMTLISQIERRGRLSARAFGGRLVRRLWPAAMTVLVAASLVTWLLAPEALRHRSFTEILASALYVENWQLALAAVDYLAASDPPTLVQHFWAMSLQGQFYVLWFLLAALALLVARRLGASPRRAFAAVLVVVLVVSLGISVWHTAVDQPFAYFSTPARLWEFAVGGLLALFLSRLEVRGRAADVLSLVALIGLVACGLVLPVGASFPGFAALWPVTCAALLLLSVRTPESAWWAGSTILSAPPLVWLGKVSYGIYLWHWPLFVGYRYLRGPEAVPGVAGGAAIVGGAIVLAIATHYLIERPVQRGWRLPGRRRALGVAIVGALVVAATLPAAGLLQLRASADADARAQAARAACAGYAGWTADEPCEPAPLSPPLANLKQDTGGAYACYAQRGEPFDPCSLGDPDAPTRAAIVGNSHAAVLTSGFRDRLDELGWSLETYSGFGCMLGADMQDPPADPCVDRWADLQAALFDDPFDVVVIAGGRGGGAEHDEEDLDAIGAVLDRLDAVGTRVVVVEDNPRPGEDGATCLAGADEQALRDGRCDLRTEDGLAIGDRFVVAAEGRPGVTVVETQDLYCRDGVCPAVIGDVIVYTDEHHLSATYTATTMDAIIERMLASEGAA